MPSSVTLSALLGLAAATATRGLPGTDGEPVPAAALQSASLAGLADLFALVVAKADDIPG